MMMEKKLDALKNYLTESGGFTPEELEGIGPDCFAYGCFDILGQEYKVFTDEEADEAAAEDIKESLWAFNADFIIQHMPTYDEMTSREYIDIEKALREMQGVLCENAGPLVKALIDDLEQFVEDAINADGRGYFIATYDGEENENGGFYIYRTN